MGTSEDGAFFSGVRLCSALRGNLGGLLLFGTSVGEASELCLVLHVGSVDLSVPTPFGDSIPAAPGPWSPGPFGAEDACSPELFGKEERDRQKERGGRD